jgi:GMP synthase-like glutamine amidotransferase
MNVLAVVHGTNVPAGVFGDEAERHGHRVDEWSLAWGTPPPLPVDEYGAVMLFGGSMHADKDDRHPWLREENLFIQRLLDLRVSVLGVCLGAQLIAKAARAPVRAMDEPEVGWIDVDLCDAARDDPVFSALPASFPTFQWHFYEFVPPAGSQELARSRLCSQAFRLGESAWAVQFHPEVTRAIVERWVSEEPSELPVSAEAFLAVYDEHAADWEELGRTLAGRFVEVAERVAVAA